MKLVPGFFFFIFNLMFVNFMFSAIGFNFSFLEIISALNSVRSSMILKCFRIAFL